MSRTFDVSFCFDENYQQHAAAAAMSVIANFEAGCENLRIHFVTQNPTEKMSAYSCSLEKIYGCSAVIHDATPHMAAIDALLEVSGIEFAHWSKAMFFKLLSPVVLPLDVGKILYLDSDTIALADVSTLFETEIGDALAAAVPEPEQYHERRRQSIGTKQYYNSGVLMMRLDLWREKNIARQCFDYLSDPKTFKKHPDQDAINFILQDQIFTLPSQWNCLTNTSPANDPLFSTIRERVSIFHFVSSKKPWHAWYDSQYGDFYWHYLNASPWRGATPEQPKTVDQHILMAQKHAKAGRFQEAYALSKKVIDHIIEKGNREGQSTN